jgi:hypothetical protein
MQWVPGGGGVFRPGREADHSVTSDVEGENVWSYTSTSPYVFMAWCLIKQTDSSTLSHTLGQMAEWVVHLLSYPGP